MSFIGICGGDPHGSAPASFSRFILPFAYQLEEVCPSYHSVGHFEPFVIPDKSWRRNYFTHETGRALFEGAQWFELKQPEKKSLYFTPKFIDSKICRIELSQPQLVLFEWKDPPLGKSRPSDTSPDLLQTGFLILEAYFADKKARLEDLLLLNEYLRYWQKPYDIHENEPSKFGFSYAEFMKGFPFCQDEPYYDRWECLLKMPVKKGGTLYRLIPDIWLTTAQGRVSAKTPTVEKSSDGGDDWLVHADTRTYVWTCAILKGGGNALREYFSMSGAPACRFGHWIKLLNVDKPKGNASATHNSTNFEKAWADKHTYKRWEEDGTFYGFNYHCGAMLGPPEKNPPLCRHFGGIYFDQTLMLLYLRVTLFRFSMALNRISAEARDKNSDECEKVREKWREDFRQLRWSFSLFTNLYQFPMLSNQQQGLEMYALARRSMDVDELFREVQQEINSSEEYLASWQTERLSKQMMRLTVVATVGAVFALAHSFPSVIKDANELIVSEPSGPILGVYALSVVVFTALILLAIYYSKELSEFIQAIASKKPDGGRLDNNEK